MESSHKKIPAQPNASFAGQFGRYVKIWSGLVQMAICGCGSYNLRLRKPDHVLCTSAWRAWCSVRVWWCVRAYTVYCARSGETTAAAHPKEERRSPAPGG